jgi:hypothetical protein
VSGTVTAVSSDAAVDPAQHARPVQSVTGSVSINSKYSSSPAPSFLHAQHKLAEYSASQCSPREIRKIQQVGMKGSENKNQTQKMRERVRQAEQSERERSKAGKRMRECKGGRER